MRIYTVNHTEILGNNKTYDLQTIFSSEEKAKIYAQWLSENNQTPIISEYTLNTSGQVFEFDRYIEIKP